MTIHAGGGEDEEITFVALSTLTIDVDKGTLKIDGEVDPVISAREPFHAKFSECKVDGKLLEKISESLK